MRHARGKRAIAKMRKILVLLTVVATTLSPAVIAHGYEAFNGVIPVNNVSPSAEEETNTQDVVEAQAQKEKLPDAISQNISDDATVISSDYVADSQGNILYASTGEKVTDERIVGTQSEVPDPLARTRGQSFIPVSVEAARGVISNESDSDSTSQNHVDGSHNQDSHSEMSDTENGGTVNDSSFRSVHENTGISAHAETSAHGSSKAFDNSQVQKAGNWGSWYGAYWNYYNGQKSFFNQNGTVFASPAKQVIDVSQWQGEIDWDTVKADGVEGAIIRIGYGTSDEDRQAERNLREVRRLGIPFGVYLYSYASNASEAWAEGQNVVRILRKAGITSSNQMALPIFYDLENWTYQGKKYPTDPAVNDTIVNNFFMNVQLSGYGSVNVYSYTSHLNTALNTKNIHSRTSWVATYGPTMNFNFSTYDRGWQYTSSGGVNGIAGAVDLNAFRFGGGTPTPTPTPQPFQVSSYPLVNLPNGEYYINSRLQDTSSFDTQGQSITLGTFAALHRYGHTGSQKYRFTRNSDGSYSIINSASGLALDVYGAQAGNLAKVNLWWPVASAQNQKWFIRDSGHGFVIQSALGNYVLDINGPSTQDGTSITLFAPGTNSTNQQFIFASTTPVDTQSMMTIRSALNGNMTFASDNTSLGARSKLQKYSEVNQKQRYSFREVGNGIYTITNVSSGYVVDVYGGEQANGTAVDLYENRNTQGQHWAVVYGENQQVSFTSMVSGKNIDVPYSSATNGTALNMWTASFNTNQRWALYRVDEHVISDGTYSIHNARERNIALDVYGGSTDNGANVEVYTYNRLAKNQQWRIVNQSGGYVKIYDSNSGKVLDIYGGTAQAGTNVSLFQDVAGARNQLWKPVRQPNGSIVLESALSSSLVLDIYGGTLTTGTNVEIYYKGSNAANQQWVFERR